MDFELSSCIEPPEVPSTDKDEHSLKEQKNFIMTDSEKTQNGDAYFRGGLYV